MSMRSELEVTSQGPIWADQLRKGKALEQLIFEACEVKRHLDQPSVCFDC